MCTPIDRLFRHRRRAGGQDMTAMLDKDRGRVAISDAQAACRSSKKPVFSKTGANPMRNRLSMLGMAIGYMGLVMILSTAPFWHQVMTPEQSYRAACTDFGGSR